MVAAFAFNGNPVPPEAQLPGGSHYSHDASSSKYIIIHCQDRLNAKDSDDLRGKGALVLKYIGSNTYICKYEPDDLKPIRSLTFVLSANVYHQDLVVNASLKTRASDAIQQVRLASAGDSQPSATSLPVQPDQSSVDSTSAPILDESFKVFIKLHPGSDEETARVKAEVARVAGIDPTTIYQDGKSRLQTTLPAQVIHLVAAVDEVQTIEEILPIRFHIHQSRRDLKIMPPSGRATDINYLNDTLRDGADEVVAVTDSGFDTWVNVGQWTANPHPLFPPARIAAVIPLGNRVIPSSSDNNGHGTHVCGCIVGQGNSTFGLARGTAPGANLVIQSINNENMEGQYPAGVGLTNMYVNPYNNQNARIHSMSWGGGLGPRRLQQQYNQGAEVVDEVMFDHPDYLIVYCAGNDGAYDLGRGELARHPQVGGESVAKNAITVGGVETSRALASWDTRFDNIADDGTPINLLHSALYYHRGAPKGDARNVAYFSSIGPTLGPAVDGAGNPLPGRIKPDVVAPGLAIFSARSRDDPMSFQAPPNPSTGLRTNFDHFGETPAADAASWVFESGTSMSAPIAAGCAAVVSKVLKNKSLPEGVVAPGPPPPAALIKALLINNTKDLRQDRPQRRGFRGQVVGAAPDPAQGYGLINMEATLRNITDTQCGGMVRNGGPLFAPPLVGITNEEHSFTIRRKRRPFFPLLFLPITLTATLVWTDYPGAALQNVLSLRAVNNGVTKYGNTMNGTRDQESNVQKVVWENITAGDTSLFVECHSIAVVVGPRLNPSQSYSLVWYVSYG